jgi:hypothetical protein
MDVSDFKLRHTDPPPDIPGVLRGRYAPARDPPRR